MQRHIKKQLKRLKREKKNRANKALAKRNRFWYAIYCIHEDMFIGVSYANIERDGGRVRVRKEQWQDSICAWRKLEYKIDMNDMKHGQEVLCPVCKHKVDFRLWMSSSKPQFIELKNVSNQTDSTQKLPDTQASGNQSI